MGFGSFVMDMYNTGSDLDLSINFGNPSVQFPREKKIQTLRKFAKKFYSLQSILASVPTSSFLKLLL